MAIDLKKTLEALIGAGNTEEVRKSLAEAQKALDDAGVARKQGEGDQKDGAAADATGEAVLEAVDAAGATMAAGTVKAVLDALDGAGALKPAQDAAGSPEALIALLLKAVSAPAAPVEDPAETMDGEMMKSMKDYIATTTKDMGDIARIQMDVAAALKTLSEDNKALRAEMADLKTKLDGRPRQASKDADTVVEGKEAMAAIQKSLEEDTVVAGIRVKKLPNGQK